MSLPIKKIYVDTKYRTRDSNSTSDFKVSLPMTVTLPENTGFYIDDICIPHSFYVIEENVNDKLYVYVKSTEVQTDYAQSSYTIVKITPGNYNGMDICIEIQEQLNSQIIDSNHPNMFIVTYNLKTNTLNIAINTNILQFRLLSTDDLMYYDTWGGASYDPNKPNDMNEILGNVMNQSPWYYINTPYKSQYLNLQTVNNIYMYSNMGNYNTIFAGAGNQGIVKKIPVSSDYGNMIFDGVVIGNDFGDCSKNTLRTLEFTLKDSRGNVINLHGSHVSFSIVFSKLDVTG
jgi:hypothetical protein